MIHAFFAVALHLSPCTIAGANAQCGTFDVPESAGSRRILHLKVIVLPATNKNRSAIFPILGGPGDAVTPGASFVVSQFAAERRDHDYVLLDERGTEGSALCPNAVKAHAREEIEDDMFPPALVADCRREIEAHADLRQFRFDDFADDIEALRRALGDGPINIVALSYGTRAALTFEARHPTSVRSMVLYGPLPPDNRPPLDFARDAQAVMDRVIPNQSELKKILNSLPHEVKSGGYTIHMTRGAFAEYLRSMLYSVEKQARVPEIVRQAAAGHWETIAPGFIEYRKNWYADLGVFLSVTCPTDVRYISSREIARHTAGTFLGDYRVRRQIAACEQWTPGLAPRVRVSSANVPILIMVGDRDAITPKWWADALAREAPRVRTIVFRNSGHADFNDCATRLETNFLNAGAFEKLDASCAQKP